MPGRADYVVELRGFEPMAIAGAERFEPTLSSTVNARSLLAARAFSITIDAHASVLSFWRRSQALQSSPRRKADRSRRGGDAADSGRIFS